MVKSKLFIVVILCVFGSSALAQSAGSSGLSFLKNGAGARNIALGDNGTVLANDASAVFYNPANIRLNRADNVFVMHNQWIQGVSTEVIAGRLTFFGIPFGIGVNSTTIRDIEIRTRPGEKEGTFDARYFMSSLSGAYSITENLTAGATGKYIYEGLFVDESSGFALDAGITYTNIFENLDVSVVMKNLGSMDALRAESTKLPAEGRIGVAYSDFRPIGDISLNGSLELQNYFASNSVHLNFGVEGLYKNMFAVRLGYMTMYEAKSLTAGVGVVWNSVSFDYAIVPFSYGLGSGHTFSAVIEF